MIQDDLDPVRLANDLTVQPSKQTVPPLKRTLSTLGKMERLAAHSTELFALPAPASPVTLSPITSQRSCDNSTTESSPHPLQAKDKITRTQSEVFGKGKARDPAPSPSSEDSLPLTHNLLKQLWYDRTLLKVLKGVGREGEELIGSAFMTTLLTRIQLHCYKHFEGVYFPNLRAGIYPKIAHTKELVDMLSRGATTSVLLEPYRRRLVEAQSRLNYTLQQQQASTPQSLEVSRHLGALIASANDSVEVFTKTLKRVLARPDTEWICHLFSEQPKEPRALLKFFERLGEKGEKKAKSAAKTWRALMNSLQGIKEAHVYPWKQLFVDQGEGAIYTSTREAVVGDFIRNGHFLCTLSVNGVVLSDGTGEELAHVIHAIHGAGFGSPVTVEEARSAAEKFSANRTIDGEPILRLLGMRSWFHAHTIMREKWKFFHSSPFQLVAKKGFQIEIKIRSSTNLEVIRRFDLFEEGILKNQNVEKEPWATFDLRWTVSPSFEQQTWNGKLELIQWEIHARTPLATRYAILQFLVPRVIGS
jgi:hypothetical protein